MPPRSFRVEIANSSTDLTLTQTFNHLCEGQWTGGWGPPGTIVPGPGSTGGLQSESGNNSFMTGTEGYVKYAVHQKDQFGADNVLGMIYVYWDNPWFGVTHFRFQSAKGDVWPDCDFTPPKGVFPPDTTSPVDFGFGFVDYQHGPTSGGDVITNIGNLLGYALAPVAGAAAAGAGPPGTEPGTDSIGAAIGYLAGVNGIDANPELDLQVFDVSSPVGPSFGAGSEQTASLKLFSDASLRDWAGNWAGGKVTLDIEPTPTGQQLSATGQDSTLSPPLSLTQTFLPGLTDLLKNETSALGILVGTQAKNPEQAGALRRAARATIEAAAAKTTVSRSETRQFFSNAVAKEGVTVSAEQTNSVGQAIAALQDNGVAYLSSGVVLHLFAVFRGADQTGLQILYQRADASGEIVVDVMLNPVDVPT
jgi:hypothetical protein